MRFFSFINFTFVTGKRKIKSPPIELVTRKPKNKSLTIELVTRSENIFNFKLLTQK